MDKVGFSTGVIYKTNKSLEERSKLFFNSGANIIELGFDIPRSLLEFNLSKDFIQNLEPYSFISIHAPFIDAEYNCNLETHKMVDKLKNICDLINISGIVVHPDQVRDFSVLEKSGLPFLMENMDIRKNDYIYPEHIEKLKNNYGFNFVLDTQHAYEHDASMNLALEILEVMGDRLHHLHLAGNNSKERHFPVHISDNKNSMIKILEGTFPTMKDYFEYSRDEINFIRSFEL